LFRDFVGEGCAPEFVQVPASTPIYIMFSSGTTGKPKCMAQSVAGVLVNHLKELIIHTDLKPGDVITYITLPSWMMWNWLMTSLPQAQRCYSMTATLTTPTGDGCGGLSRKTVYRFSLQRLIHQQPTRHGSKPKAGSRPNHVKGDITDRLTSISRWL
jgi:hypothetical protein